MGDCDVIKDINGVIIKDAKPMKERWKEHFSSVLNKGESLHQTAEEHKEMFDDNRIKINITTIRRYEVVKALNGNCKILNRQALIKYLTKC